MTCYHDEIKTEALDLGVQCTKTIFCPFCDNCEPYPPSLSITRVEQGILYNCYRASCGKRGFLGSTVFDLNKKPKKKEFVPKCFTKETRQFSDDEYKFFWDKYFITPEMVQENSWKWIVGEQSIVMPVLNRYGYTIGRQVKRFDNKKKAILYLTNDAPVMHYVPNSAQGTTVIVVEDQLSAVRVNEFEQGVALIGTAMSEDKVKDLLNAGVKRVIMCLDPDALTTAIKWKRKYTLFFKEFIVKNLSKDPKDLSPDQLQKELEWNKNL